MMLYREVIMMLCKEVVMMLYSEVRGYNVGRL